MTSPSPAPQLPDFSSAVLPLAQNGHVFSREDQIRVVRYGGEAPMFMDHYHECTFCGVRPDLTVVDEVVHAAGPCPSPDGVTTRVTLEVPSGRIIVTDDLRPVYDVDDSGMVSYNTAAGQAQYVEAMARIGCAYGPVGNTCPGLYRTGPDTYVIANLAYDEETDEETLPDGWTRVAGIVTDLWAYSIADYDDWVARGGDPKGLNWSDSVVDVTPGTYRFTHHSGERSFDRDSSGLVVFADIERLPGATVRLGSPSVS